MSDPAVAVQHQQIRQRSVIASIVTFPFRFLGVICGSLLLCILIEWIGIHFFWPEQSWRHAQSMVNYELDQLSTYFTHSVVAREPGRTAHQVVKHAYDWIFLKTGLLEWVQNASAQASNNSPGQAKEFQYYLSLVYFFLESYLIAAGYTVLVFVVRLLVLCLMLPLFFMAGFVGLVDGLVRRDIRRFGAGRESSFVYHRAKAMLMPLLVLPWMVYLAMPISVNPLMVLMPSAILLGLAMNIAAGSFKKYL
jgi:integrating conjugative element membrane protein (TIGR03747 family)